MQQVAVAPTSVEEIGVRSDLNAKPSFECATALLEVGRVRCCSTLRWQQHERKRMKGKVAQPGESRATKPRLQHICKRPLAEDVEETRTADPVVQLHDIGQASWKQLVTVCIEEATNFASLYIAMSLGVIEVC
jgi:hypothetical protein